MTTVDRAHGVWQRWPAALGLVAAVAVLALAPSREAVATSVVAATFCYLAAAAFDRRRASWAALLATFVLPFPGALLGTPPWLSLAVAALVLVAIGLFGGVPRAALGAQTAAVVGYGGLAVLGLYLSPGIGLAVAGLALAAHALWDLVHLRRDVVVSRSLAEACVWFDVPLGLGVLVLAALG